MISEQEVTSAENGLSSALPHGNTQNHLITRRGGDIIHEYECASHTLYEAHCKPCTVHSKLWLLDIKPWAITIKLVNIRSLFGESPDSSSPLLLSFSSPPAHGRNMYSQCVHEYMGEGWSLGISHRQNTDSLFHSTGGL